MFKLTKLLHAIVATCLLTPLANANQISISEFPRFANADGTGAFPDLVRALTNADGSRFDVTVVPFVRSIKMVTQNESIAHMPLLDPEDGSAPAEGLAYSSVKIYDVSFSIFYNSANPITPEQLEQGIKVEILAAHSGLFDFEAEKSSCLPCSLKKVDGGRIDAFVFATLIGQGIVGAENLSNVSSLEYRSFPSRFVIREGDEATDALLTAAMDRLAASGQLEALISPLVD